MDNIPGGVDRRRSKRLPIIAKVEWDENTGDRYCQTKDISQNGAFIVSNELVPVGKLLDLEIAIPERGQAIQVRARVIRHEVGDSFTNRQRGFGVEFIELGPAAEQILKELSE